MPNENDNKLVTLADLAEAYNALYNRDVMTPEDKQKLNGIEAGAQVNSVTSVNNQTGAVSITPANIGAVSTSAVIGTSHGGTGAEKPFNAVQNLFDVGFSDSSITQYPNPCKPGIYRTVGVNIFNNMYLGSGANGYYGVLIIFKAGYGLHMYLNNKGELYFGYSGSAFQEPETWYKATTTAAPKS